MRKELDSPAPSIRKVIIKCDVPKNYGAYSYWFKSITDKNKDYIGIKKDKLPMDNGEDYWSSSDNVEFLLDVQGNKEMFDLHITECVSEEMFVDLQIKEDALLKKKYPDIKNDNRTYNNAYGILPFSKSNLIPSNEDYKIFREMCKTQWLQKKLEKVKDLLKMHMAQIRWKLHSQTHVSDIAHELNEVAGNTKNMQPVLIMEGVGHIFEPDKPDWKNEDVIVGRKHGLLAMERVKSQEAKTCRVPYSFLEDKSEHYLRALAAHDNFVEGLDWKPSYEDIAKLLVSLNKDSKGKISPYSQTAKEHIKETYGKVGHNKIKKGQDRANTIIEMGLKNNTSWKTYTEKDKDKINKEIEDNFPERLSICIAVGMWDYRKVLDAVYEDMHVYGKGKNGKKIITAENKGQSRKDITINTWANELSHLTKWNLDYSSHFAQLKYYLDAMGVTFRFNPLINEVPDTTKTKKED